MTWRERLSMAAEVGRDSVNEHIYHWTEARKGTSKRYGFLRVGNSRKKYSLGSDPVRRNILLAAVFTERDRHKPYWVPPGSEVKPTQHTRQFYAHLRRLQNMALGATGRHHDGEKIRFIRGVDAEEAWRREFRSFSRPLLEARTWPGISEDQWVALRREMQAETKRRARLGIRCFHGRSAAAR